MSRRVVSDRAVESAEDVRRYWRLYKSDMLRLNIQFEPRNLLLGVGWTRTQLCFHAFLSVPCLSLHLTRLRRDSSSTPQRGDDDDRMIPDEFNPGAAFHEERGDCD